MCVCVGAHVYIMMWNRFSFITTSKGLSHQIVLSQQSHVIGSSFVPLIITKSQSSFSGTERERRGKRWNLKKGRGAENQFLFLP